MSHWQDKVVLVTGGSAGFGLAITKAFANAGAKVVIAALDDGQLAPAVADLRSGGARSSLRFDP